MNHTAKRMTQAAVAAALLETAAAAIRSHSFYPVSVLMNTVVEIVYFLVIVYVAALFASQIGRSISWLQRILFFGIVLAPSLFSYTEFFREATYYQQGGIDSV